MQIIADRRALHRIPELDKDLPEPLAYLRSVLTPLACRVFSPMDGALCDTGLFAQYQVEAIFGLHIWPGLEKGLIAARKGEMMSRSCEVKVDIFGKAAHIAKAAEGIDALSAGICFYQKVKEAEAALPADIFRVLNFGISSEEFCTRLIREGKVAAVPGSCFGTEGYIRISCCCSDEALEEGLNRLEAFLQTL